MKKLFTAVLAVAAFGLIASSASAGEKVRIGTEGAYPPFNSIDPSGKLVGEVLRVIRQLAEEGRTMIVVTHEVGFAREVVNNAVFLHEGRIEEEGPPKEIFGNQRSERFRQFLASHLT